MKIELINGLPRMTAESGSPTILDSTLLVVASNAGTGEILESNAEAGDYITLPDAITYVGDELEVYFNGVRMDSVLDYNFVGTGTKTQIATTFNLKSGDRLRFRVDRGA
jgi:hypothetical protein